MSAAAKRILAQKEAEAAEEARIKKLQDEEDARIRAEEEKEAEAARKVSFVNQVLSYAAEDFHFNLRKSLVTLLDRRKKNVMPRQK